jgi:hypothetical protein
VGTSNSNLTFNFNLDQLKDQDKLIKVPLDINNFSTDISKQKHKLLSPEECAIKTKQMSHSDIIIIVGTLTFASIFGPYVAIKLIKQYTRPPINTLQRSGDIELMDYIEPAQPQQTHYPLDLLDPAFPIYERFTAFPIYERVPVNY